LAIGAKRGPIGKLVVVVGQPIHDLDGFSVFHRVGKRAHCGRAVAPVLGIVYEFIAIAPFAFHIGKRRATFRQVKSK
jgi:hypothetical protein